MLAFARNPTALRDVENDLPQPVDPPVAPRAAAGWLALVGLVAVATFVLGEVMVRWVDPPILSDDFPIILGTPAMAADDSGAVRFVPRTQVRYALSTRHGLEYDVRFRTNNLGYVDERDYPLPASDARTLAFVGDSYSVGAEGGEPWVPRLRGLTAARIYNLGMPAAGVMHFERALASFSRVEPLAEIVIVATSDDFFRPLWRPLARPDGVCLCAPGVSDAECSRQEPLFRTIGAHDAPEAVQRTAEEVRRRSAAPRSALRDVLRGSKLLRFLARLPSLGRLLARRDLYAPNVEALRAIRARFPQATIRMVHVPDKHESAAGRYTVDVAQALAASRIDYFRVLERCPLQAAMYYPRDNHPNASGYASLMSCVAGYLDLRR